MDKFQERFDDWMTWSVIEPSLLTAAVWGRLQANKACTGRLVAVGGLCGLAGLVIGWFMFGG